MGSPPSSPSPWGELPDWFDSDNSEDDEEGSSKDENDEGYHLGAFHCLMLIDCGSPGMFDPCPVLRDLHFPDDTVPPMDFVIQAAEGMVRSKIKSTMITKTGKRDAFGILLYNTRCRRPVKDGSNEEELSAGVENDHDDDDDEDGDLLVGSLGTRSSTVHEFIPLEPPGVSTVKCLRSVQDDPIQGREKSLQKLYAPTKDDEAEDSWSENALQTALSRAMDVFQSSKFVHQKKTQVSDTKQIWIFTADDDPCKGKDDTMTVVRTFIADAQDGGIDICIWPLPYGDVNGLPQKTIQMFDYAKFYDQVGAMTPFRAEDSEDNQQEGAEPIDLTAVIEDMQCQWKKTNRSFSLPLLLPNWKTDRDFPGIFLDVYRLIQVGMKPSKLDVHQETGRLLTKVELVSTSTGQILLKKVGGKVVDRASALTDRVMGYVEFGGDHVRMSEEDKTMLKRAANANSDFASLILLGFKDATSISPTDIMGQAYFAYPNENHTAGSREAFAYLHSSMKRKGVLAIGEMLSRKTSTSRQVAFWPLAEIEKEDGESAGATRPPGMMIVELPFEEEVREKGTDAAIQEKVTTGRNLASPDVVDAFAALVERQSWDNVEIGEVFENADLSRFWDYVEHVALGLPLPAKHDEYDTIPDEAAISKRVEKELERVISLLPDDVIPEKVPKKRQQVPDDSGVDWRDVYQQGQVAKCRAEDLKKKLKSVGERVGGNKSELVDRIMPYLQKEFEDDIKVKIEGL